MLWHEEGSGQLPFPVKKAISAFIPFITPVVSHRYWQPM